MKNQQPTPARPKRRSIREALADRRAAKTEEHRSAKTQTLVALQGNAKHIYAGTVPADVVAGRRAANKRARASRRANRKH